MIGYGYRAVSEGISVRKAVGGIPIIGGFMSRIFKKPQTKDGFAKFIQVYTEAFRVKGEAHYPKFVRKFMERRSMVAKEKKECTVWVLHRTRNWTKAQKKNLQQACSQIRVKTEKKIATPEVHKVSSSYDTATAQAGIQKSRDAQEVVQAEISKIPVYVLVGIGAMLLLPGLLKGGKK